MIRRNIIYLMGYSEKDGTARAVQCAFPSRMHFVKNIEDRSELCAQIEEDFPLFIEDCKDVSYTADKVHKSMACLAGRYYETIYVPVNLGEVGFVPPSTDSKEVHSTVKNHFAKFGRIEMEHKYTYA